MPEIGEKIRAIREQKSLSRRAFGDLLGTSEAKIQAVEIGKQRVDHVLLGNITRVLGLDANWLLSETTTITPPISDNSHQNGNFIQIKRYDIAASAGHGAVADKENETGY